MERKKLEFKMEDKKDDPEFETVWVEAKAENGTPYYFHMFNGGRTLNDLYSKFENKSCLIYVLPFYNST